MHLAIFGPGLIGGSLALSARRRALCTRLSIWSHDPAERAHVRELGWADLVTDDPARAVDGADLIFLCTPLSALAGLAGRIAAHLAPGAVVSDVGSTKGPLVAELTAILGRRYVGAHPMAGAELSGLAAARADLFDGRVCLLTPLAGRTDPPAVETVRRFWEALGARVRQMSPPAHDEAVALVSHLPHVLAATLTNYVGSQAADPTACAGPGWRDVTRLAGGNPDLWTEILSRNRRPVTTALHGTIEKLREVLALLEIGREADLARFLDEAKRRRDSPLS